MYTSEPTCKESLTVTQVCHCRATAARRALPPATRPGLALPLIPVLQAKLRQPCPSPARHLAAPRHDSPMRAPAPAAQPVLRALRRGSDRTAPGRRHAPVCRQKARGGSPGASLRGEGRSAPRAARRARSLFSQLRRGGSLSFPPLPRAPPTAAGRYPPLQAAAPLRSLDPIAALAPPPRLVALPPGSRLRRGRPRGNRAAAAVPPGEARSSGTRGPLGPSPAAARSSPSPPAGGRGSGGSVSRGPLPAPPRPAPARRGLRHKYGPERRSRGGAAGEGSAVVAAATRAGGLAWDRVRGPRSVPTSHSHPLDPPCPRPPSHPTPRSQSPPWTYWAPWK